MVRKAALIAAVCGALAACATPYQPSGFAGGFKETKLNADTYEITVGGNGYTSKQRVRDMALLRAAELTIKEGSSNFVVVNGQTSSSYGGTTPIVANRVGNTVTFSGGEDIYRPDSTMIIKIIRSKDDPQYPNSLDAKLIDSQLRPRLT